MAAALAGGSLGRVPARLPPARGRFRGCLAGALLGDCLGATFEGREVVALPELLRYLRGLEPPGRAGGSGEEADGKGGGRGGAHAPCPAPPPPTGPVPPPRTSPPRVLTPPPHTLSPRRVLNFPPRTLPPPGLNPPPRAPCAPPGLNPPAHPAPPRGSVPPPAYPVPPRTLPSTGGLSPPHTLSPPGPEPPLCPPPPREPDSSAPHTLFCPRDVNHPVQTARETLCYTDDTAMARCVVRSLLAKGEFDQVDMARRFAEEHKKEPDRGYGMAVVKVFKKLLSPKCSDVFEPARVQFNGKGSYGNGGAMRVAGVSLIYPEVQDVKKFAKLSAELTHANSLGYNGAILQALAVHLALQGELSRESFLEQLIGHMEDVEADDKSLADARAMGFEELPFSRRLKKIKEFLELSTVPKSDVLLELGNGIAALESVPTAIYSFLRSMKSDPDIPDHYNNLQRVIIYCISLGGDTDTIATMAGAIAGAYYGEEQVPPCWEQSCEAFQETEMLANSLHELYCQRL